MGHWTKIHLENHLSRATAWKQSKALHKDKYNAAPSYTVLCAPAGSDFWVNSHWNVNHVQDYPIMTISSKDLFETLDIPTSSHSPSLSSPDSVATSISQKRTLASVPYCLDAGDMKENSTVTVSLCYPSELPKSNSDRHVASASFVIFRRSQQWILAPDATIRPYWNQNLCVSNRPSPSSPSSSVPPSAIRTVVLEICADEVTQHWAYHGAAAGNDNSGDIFYGDDTNSLGFALSK